MTPSSSARQPDPDQLVDRVRAFVLEHGLFPRDTAIVAVSGGADSRCLLDTLTRLGPKSRPQLVVGHVDHALRPDSSRDASFVEQIASELSLPCRVTRVDVRGYADRHRLGLEVSARALRYQALAEIASEFGTTLVATGHTSDDSAESFLLHLLRGAGPEGLRGINWRQNTFLQALGPVEVAGRAVSVMIVRPLLRVTRAETVAYCAARRLEWLDDPTNLDPSFLRNRVRHHLLPTLRTYNPAITQALSRTADLLRADNTLSLAMVHLIWPRVALPLPDGVAFDVAAFRRCSLGARRRLVRQAVAEVGVASDAVGFEAVERILALAVGPLSGRVQLSRHVAVSRAGDQLQFRRESTP